MKVPLAFSLAQNADIDGEDTNRAATMKNACDLVPVINANDLAKWLSPGGARMFKAVINAETLRDAIESVSSLVDEVKFTVLETGLELKAADPANVAMVSL